MPDPNLTLAAIQSHTTALDGAIRRHVAHSGWCKVGSAMVVLGVVLLASGKAQMAVLPWVAGVVALLALADACQVLMARLCTDAYHAFMQKLPLNGGNAMKAEECFVLPAPEPTWQQAGRVLGALGSLSVLPFYGALLALLIAFHVQMSPPSPSASTASAAKSAGCSAGGGCGTSGGCGSGGCGASSGKGCGCGSGAAAKSSQSANAGSPSATPQPAQPVRMTTLPVNPNTGVQTRPTTLQPGQPPTLSPLRPVQPQPGLRLPTIPPNRLPGNGGPANGQPTNGLPPQGAVPAPVPGAGGTPTLPPAPPILGAEPAAPAKGSPPVPAVPGQK
jgi:hypothetical protein